MSNETGSTFTHDACAGIQGSREKGIAELRVSDEHACYYVRHNLYEISKRIADKRCFAFIVSISRNKILN